MLDTLRLLVDFGLVILIWLVQLVIYPGFRACSPEGLARWHPAYSGRVTVVVAPLMFGQLFLVIHEVWTQEGMARWLIAALVAVAWLATFLLSVPAHSKIASGRGMFDAVDTLVRTNWIRTWAWTAVFLLHAHEQGLLAFMLGA